MINDQDMLYFGVKELCDSTRWNQQFSLIRTEETLDWALPKANRYLRSFFGCFNNHSTEQFCYIFCLFFNLFIHLCLCNL